MMTSGNDSLFATLRRRSVPFITLLIAFVASGCASLQSGLPAGPAEPTSPEPASVRYTVKPGDRLGDIARDITGDVDNWTSIAAHNGIDDARRLAVGSVLEIPGTLLHDSQAAEAAGDVAPEQRLAEAGPSTPARLSRVALVSPANVIVTPANPNKRFDLSPLEAGTSGGSGTGVRQVKVVGTYYPKGVYTRPDGASQVIMRIAPGTLLELEREYDGWFKVATAEGTGYLRVSDGEVPRRGTSAGPRRES